MGFPRNEFGLRLITSWVERHTLEVARSSNLTREKEIIISDAYAPQYTLLCN